MCILLHIRSELYEVLTAAIVFSSTALVVFLCFHFGFI